MAGKVLDISCFLWYPLSSHIGLCLMLTVWIATAFIRSLFASPFHPRTLELNLDRLCRRTLYLWCFFRGDVTSRVSSILSPPRSPYALHIRYTISSIECRIWQQDDGTDTSIILHYRAPSILPGGPRERIVVFWNRIYHAWSCSSLPRLVWRL